MLICTATIYKRRSPCVKEISVGFFADTPEAFSWQDSILEKIDKKVTPFDKLTRSNITFSTLQAPPKTSPFYGFIVSTNDFPNLLSKVINELGLE